MKRYGKPVLSVFEQVMKPLVGVGRHAEAAELPRGPVLAPVHRGINSTRVGRPPWIAEIVLVIEITEVFGRVQPLDGHAGNGRECSEALDPSLYGIADVFCHLNLLQINHNGDMHVGNQNLAIEEEKRRYRRLQFLMDLTLSTIAQSRMSYEETLQLIQSARQAALRLFPGKEEAFEMIYMSRFRRLVSEKFRFDPL